MFVIVINKYSQTCLCDHIYKATTCLIRPVLSSPKQILIQSSLYKTVTCLMRPATTFFVSQMKKICPKKTNPKLSLQLYFSIATL